MSLIDAHSSVCGVGSGCKPFGNQGRYNLVGRVGIHLEFVAQGPHRRKGLAGKKLARHDSLLHRIDHLLVNRQARLKLDSVWELFWI